MYCTQKCNTTTLQLLYIVTAEVIIFIISLLGSSSAFKILFYFGTLHPLENCCSSHTPSRDNHTPPLPNSSYLPLQNIVSCCTITSDANLTGHLQLNYKKSSLPGSSHTIQRPERIHNRYHYYRGYVSAWFETK